MEGAVILPPAAGSVSSSPSCSCKPSRAVVLLQPYPRHADAFGRCETADRMGRRPQEALGNPTGHDAAQSSRLIAVLSADAGVRYLFSSFLADILPLWSTSTVHIAAKAIGGPHLEDSCRIGMPDMSRDDVSECMPWRLDQATSHHATANVGLY